MPIFGKPVKTAKMVGTKAGGNIRQFFGENPVNYAFLGLKGHNGLDIATFKGDDVLAVADGVIFDAATVDDAEREQATKFNGNVVWLLTDVLADGKPHLVVYGHLDSICVKKDKLGRWPRVKCGDVIGKQGNTGYVTSDTSAFWGAAPANMGVHTHLSHYEMEYGDDGYGSYFSGGKFWHIKDPKNGYKGATDPFTLFDDDPNIPLLVIIRDLLRSIIGRKGGTPVN